MSSPNLNNKYNKSYDIPICDVSIENHSNLLSKFNFKL
jgi:hypothetical protein